MKLSFGERQPFRIWYQYLQTCLNDEILSKKVDKKFYKDWNLKLISSQYTLKKRKKVSGKLEKRFRKIDYPFDKWIEKHEHLFVDLNTQMKISTGTKNLNSVLVEIPINYSITKVQREVGKVLENKLNKSLSKFRITSNRPLILPPLDYFLYAWKIKHQSKTKLTLEDIWKKTFDFIESRANKKRILTMVEKGKFKKRRLEGQYYTKITRNRAILISRNISKAQRILENVCRGIFTGNYSDH